MKIRHGCVLSAAAMLILAGTAGVAFGQATATKSVATPVAANDAQAKQLLDKARAAYKAAKSYQDKTALKFEMRAKDTDGNDQTQDETEEMTFVFAGPRKFAMAHKDFSVYSDGQLQTAHLKIIDQYVQQPTEDALMDEARRGPIGILSALHIPAALLISPAKHETEFPLLTKITAITAEERNGKPGKRISGAGVLADLPIDGDVPITLWMSDQTGLIGEVTLDLQPAYTKMLGEQMKIEKAMGTISFEEIQLNAEIPAEKYTFKPGAADKKVDSFQGSDGPDMQQELVGKPSPDFKGVDLEGKPLNLSDFKGKVVLLDFWATWCPPCMQMIPRIQEISAEYADKGVVVIGMNQDSADAVEAVKKTVASKNLTFRQFMDPEGETAGKFNVTGIPCTVLIDGAGVIQWIHTGGSPSLKKEIGEKLDILLKGGSLIKKEEPQKDEPKK